MVNKSENKKAAVIDTVSKAESIVVEDKVLETTASTSDKKNETKKTTLVPTVLPGAGVIYLSRIPHGFYEDQMRAYFSQFGEITRLRMARNKRTGASKHYAYIEFRHEAVAKIVAETMHNYLMFGRLLQCYIVPVDKVHPDTFVGANRRFKVIPWKRIARETHNAEETEEKVQVRMERQMKHIKSVGERCKELGIVWDAKDL